MKKVKHKRGDTREDGMVFWAYAKCIPSGAFWVDSGKFYEMREKSRKLNAERNSNPEIKERANELRRIRAKKPEVIERKRKREKAARSLRIKDPEYVAKTNARQRKWHKTKATDYEYKIRRTLRSRLYWAVRKSDSKKKISAIHHLGCSTSFLREYLKTRFTHNMTWDNHGKVWHIDHIRPLASFDLSKMSEQKKASHYTNLQPMLAFDNLSKGERELKQQKLI